MSRRVTATPVGGIASTALGHGPPVMLIHGYCGAQDDWRDVVGLLVAADRRVVSIDLPGHGRSSLRAPLVTLHDLADVIGAVMVDLDLRETTVAGHSLGSLAVLHLASRHGRVVDERVRSLALVSATLSPWRPPELATLALGGHPFSRPVLQVPVFGRAAVRAAAFAPNSAQQQVDRVRQTWARPSYRTRWAYVAGAPSHLLVRRGLRAIERPTVVLTGRQDRLTPPERARHLADHLPSARLELVEEAGHAVLTERPHAVAEALLAV